MERKDLLAYSLATIGVLVFIGGLCYVFSYLFTGLYWDCGDMTGRTKEEVLLQMERYTRAPYVLVQESIPGSYGWHGSLQYVSSLIFAHNYRHYECKVLLNEDDNVLETVPFFD